MRIPTILGISLILTLSILAIMFSIYNHESETKNRAEYTPQNIRYSNIQSDSFSISWTSQQPSIGVVSWGESPELGNVTNDDRDISSQQNRLTHFVTIRNLKPDTDYYIKVRNSLFFYPNQPLKIRTAGVTNKTTANPILGRVLNSRQEPVDEALIFLEIPGASPLATFITTSGNFILPLTGLTLPESDPNTNQVNKLRGNLIINRGKMQSTIQLLLPRQNILPPIILGQNLDLTGSDSAN